jgi:alcohol dehydrogenase class IV
VAAPFTWIDGERLIRFGWGALADAADLLASRGFERYALLTTERAAVGASGLVDEADAVLHVPPGPVPDIAAALRDRVEGRPLVALGGGRVVDAAKAIAAVDDLACAAVPTTLAGSPMTPFHRLPPGATAERLVRPALVVWDPTLAASLPREQLVATALNAIAHAFESLYTPFANPISTLAALRAAELFGNELLKTDPASEEVGLAALLAGYAVGATGFAAHHALCQTVVRVAGTPHAQTNAVVLPHTAAFVGERTPEPVGRFATALGAPSGTPAGASELLYRLSVETGVNGLKDLGIESTALAHLADKATRHPAMGSTPGGAPSRDELEQILHAAL